MSRNALLAATAIALCIVCLLLGFLLASNSPELPAAAANDTLPPQPPASTPAAPQPEDETQILRRTLADFSDPSWSDIRNGCQIDRDKTEFHIVGTQNKTGWVDNGLASSLALPDGDFSNSVDVQLVKPPAGTSPRNAYIRVSAADRSAIGVFEDDRAICSVQDWKNPQTHSPASFRDIDPASFHRLTLAWNDAAQSASATIDGRKIGTIQTSLGTRRKLTLFANSNATGTPFDIHFKNLSLSSPPSRQAALPPEPRSGGFQ